MNAETVSRSQRYLALALAFRPPEAGAPRDRALAYTRLFLGPGRPIAHPYESVYLEGQLMGAATAQVAACYAEAGLRMNTAGHELPDHVSLELAFMAHLAAQAERDSITNHQLQITNNRQRRFLREHLARWLPQFCEKIEASNAHPFYCEAARTVKRLIEEEETHLATGDWRLEIGDCGMRNEQSAIRNPQSAIEHSAIRNTQYATRKRYPNIHLGVNFSHCTLCTLCADNCQPGALTVESTPTTLSLTFDPAHCNGCRACLRLCPEDAITIERGPPLAASGGVDHKSTGRDLRGLRRPRRSSALLPPATRHSPLVTAPRVLCPDCQRPHIATPWLERLAGRLGGGESVRRKLALCPFCKAAPGDGSRVPRHSPPAPRHSLESFASV